MATRWIDLVDPTREEILRAVAATLDPDAVEILAAPATDARVTRPLLEAHGGYVLAVLSRSSSSRLPEGVAYQELDVIASPGALVTVRKLDPRGELAPVDGVAARVEADAKPGEVVHAVVDDAAEAFVELLDGLYEKIDELETDLEGLPGSEVRLRVAALRHDCSSRDGRRARRAESPGACSTDASTSATRSSSHPTWRRSSSTPTRPWFVRRRSSTSRATCLRRPRRLPGEGHGAAERRREEAHRDRLVVLVPSLIVGFYGQNFEDALSSAYWSLGVSVGLIVTSTIAQLVLFRWRRWI